MSATQPSGTQGATGTGTPEGAASLGDGIGKGESEHATPSWQDVTLQDVYDARIRIMTHLHRTPMLNSRTLSDLSNTNLGLKAELFQRTGSFKSRGALNAALQLTPEQRERGLVTMSAGNHGQGLAFAGSMVGTRTVVFMPKTAVPTKIEAIRGYGAEPMFHDNMEGLFDAMDAYRIEHDLTYVSPFDDKAIIAGQGVIGLEILEDMPDVKTVIVPVGGGGLISGIAMAVKSLRPDVRVVGVEPTGANIVRRSLDAGRPLAAESITTVADGLAAPFAGNLSQAIIEHYVDDVILVSDEQIIDALKLILHRLKVMVEPAGAASTAGLLSGLAGAEPGSNTVVVLSGGNIDPAKLKSFL